MIEILVDVHERESRVAEKLRLLGWAVQEVPLEAGDYLLGGLIGIERKTVTDFVSSLTHGRLFRQLSQLRRSVHTPVLIIEGERDNVDGLHPNVIKGTLVTISVNLRIPILWSRNIDETASLLSFIAKQNARAPRRWQPQGARKPASTSETQRELLGRIPQIGRCSAEALLHHFGNFEAVLNASASDLRAVKGIGQKRAALVYNVLHEASTTYRVP